MRLALTTLAMMISATFAVAEDASTGLVITDVIAFETPETARSGAGYLTIENTSEESDRLLSVSADFPRVMIHQTEMDGDVMKMFHVEAIDIPANEAVTLAPGGYHVMFMGLDAPLVSGEAFDATLLFEKAGEVAVVFNVEKRPMAGHEDH